MNEILRPNYNTGFTVSPGASTASSVLLNASSTGNNTIVLTSLNGVQCYVAVGDSTVTASAADYPIPINGQVVIEKLEPDTHIAYIAPAGGGSLHIMSGVGF